MRKTLGLTQRYPVVAMTLSVGIISGVVWALGAPNLVQWIITVYAGLFVLWSAYDMIRDMMRGHFGLDVLALMAITATLAVGEYWASLVVVLMLSGGEALEDYAANKARSELTALLERTPTEAHLLARSGEKPPADGQTTDIPVDEAQVGDLLLVRPGDTVPVDCQLVSDDGSFDESSITGESLPVWVTAGEEIPSGAINGPDAVIVRTVRRSADSQYQQIIRLVQESEDAKAPVVRLADRYAVPFTLVSLAIASVAWMVSGDPVRFAEVLVLATPCPLLIAAPVAFMGGMSRSARAGVIVKGGAVLEQAAHVKSVAFDKTGTLTEGKPVVVALQPAASFSSDDLLQMAASAEQYSSHVLASGIRNAGANRRMALLPVDDAHEIHAQGVEAQLGAQTLRVGRLGYVKEFAPDTYRAELQPGQAVVYVARDNEYVGAVILADQIRPEAAQVVHWLLDNGIENVAMFSGDSQHTAETVGTEIGITHVRGDLQPVDKVRLAAELEPEPTMMVGDGVNDAPVLAATDVGVAMGARGSTAAGEAADAVILKDSLVPLPSLITIARDTLKVALTAIWIGIVLSVALMLIATTGVIPAIVGAALQEVLDLVTILYALRALTGKLPEFKAKAPLSGTAAEARAY